jgi:tripartite-type tricarboxylate transporter receptor subunit TctC
MFGQRRIAARYFSSIAALAAIALSLGGQAHGEDFFAGKQIRLIVPAGPAGGYGLYGQLAAQHLGRFIPGNPNIVLSYMPGAGGLVAMNYLYEAAPHDGTVFAVIAQDVHYQQALGKKGVRYDATKFNYIGRATSNVPVHMVWSSAPAQSIDELKKHEVATGAVGGMGSQLDLPRASNALIGTKWKIIAGYKGNNETRIAMERGETQAAISPATLFNAQLKPWLDKGKVKVVVQYADFRHPTFPDVPTIVELAPTPEAKGVLKLLASVATVGRGYGLPPSRFYARHSMR